MTPEEQAWALEQFGRCSRWLQDALDRSYGEYDLSNVKAMIEAGSAQIWPLPNSCIVTFIETFPTGLKVLKWWLAGGDLDEVLTAEPVIEKWAIRAGCTKAVIGGRRGWLRKLPGYHEQYTVIAKDLK